MCVRIVVTMYLRLPYRAGSGLISVRSARGSARSELLSPMSSLLVETRQILQWLPEQQAASLLSALLRGASPVRR